MCATQTISDLEAVIGNLGTKEWSLFNFVADVQTLLASNLAAITCTECVKQSFAIARQGFPQLFSDIVQPMQDICGASFVGK